MSRLPASGLDKKSLTLAIPPPPPQFFYIDLGGSGGGVGVNEFFSMNQNSKYFLFFGGARAEYW